MVLKVIVQKLWPGDVVIEDAEQRNVWIKHVQNGHNMIEYLLIRPLMKESKAKKIQEEAR